MAFGFAACNDEGVNVNVNADSLGNKLDTLGTKIEDKAEQVWDSTKSKAGQLKDDIEARFDSAGKKRSDTL